MALKTWPDIGGYPELEISATKPEVTLSFRISGHVGSVISESGSFRSTVISTSFFRGRHFGFLMSADVGRLISESSIVENVGVAAGAALKSISFQTFVILPVLVAAILNFGCRQCHV
jgi:hypothetical protein